MSLPRDGKFPEISCVVKRFREKDGIPIGTANDKPILDSQIDDVEYPDGNRASLETNVIAENLFAQVDDVGHHSVLLQEIVNHRVNGREVTKVHAFIISHNGGRLRKETTQGWEILIQWKYESTTWELFKYAKENYLVQEAEYAHQYKISDRPEFTWGVPHVLKKRESIIAKVNSKYWLRTHKFGIRVPKTVEEAKRLDQQNGNHL